MFQPQMSIIISLALKWDCKHSDKWFERLPNFHKYLSAVYVQFYYIENILKSLYAYSWVSWLQCVPYINTAKNK